MPGPGAPLWRVIYPAVRMLAAEVPPPAFATPASANVLRGRTSDGTRISLSLSSQRITRVTVTIGRYICEPEGDIGPVRISGVPYPGRIHARGRFGFSIGAASERLRVDGASSHDRKTVRGSLRLTGTIGRGDPCRSPRVTYSAQLAGT